MKQCIWLVSLIDRLEISLQDWSGAAPAQRSVALWYSVVAGNTNKAGGVDQELMMVVKFRSESILSGDVSMVKM